MKITDTQMEDIPYPKTELYIHVITKFVQGFALLGTTVVGPIVALARKQPVAATAFRYGTRGGLIGGPPVGIAATYAKLRTVEDEEAVKDRCYRLRLNEGQMR